jgi:NAD(P)H dehydrogenase (quinone)
MPNTKQSILVTGAAGRVGSVGRMIVARLRDHDYPVRALVHRDDERADALRALGAEVLVGDLTRADDVMRAMKGCRRVYFGMSVSASYLEATTTAVAVARELGDLEVFVNISQMTVSQMSLTQMTDSPQQRLHWLAEQVINWSGLPSVHVRPTVFLENPLFLDIAAQSIKSAGVLRLPFGTGRSSPISARDVAHVAARILEQPSAHIGKIYELTGARCQDMNEVAREYAEALGQPVRYVAVPFEDWRDRELRALQLPSHVFDHITTMAQLHADNRYDRFTDTVRALTGEAPMSVRDFVSANRKRFV